MGKARILKPDEDLHIYSPRCKRHNPKAHDGVNPIQVSLFDQSPTFETRADGDAEYRLAATNISTYTNAFSQKPIVIGYSERIL